MPGDDLYWNPEETEDSLQEKEPYIDPWDLENYAYIRNHLDYTELNSSHSIPSGSSGEFAEAASHSFQYVPGFERGRLSRSTRINTEWTNDQENYAAIDEIGIYDKRARSDLYVPMSRRRIMDEYDSDVEEVSPYAEGTVRNSSVFGIYDEKGHFRRVALPVPTGRPTRDRSLSFSYGDFEHEKDLDLESYLPEMEPEVYSARERRHSYKPDHFSLSKHGHLKIDYSYSWNNLNKYIRFNN